MRTLIFSFLVFTAVFSIPLVDPPTQIHLAFAGSDGMTVSWMTNTDSSTPFVQYSTDENFTSPMIAQGYTVQYDVTHHHHVVIKNLKPATKYFYTAYNQNSQVKSTTLYFITSPGSSASFNVAMVADMGIANSNETMKLMVEKMPEYDWIMHGGDFAYSDDRKEKKFEDIWDQYMNEIESFTSTKPYMTCPGNHEATCHSYGRILCENKYMNFTSYRHRFRMPADESQSTAGNMWYSFDYGLVHFIAISTESDYPHSPEGHNSVLYKTGPFGDQESWLKADLEKADKNRDQVPWIIIVGHRPIYSSDTHDFPFFSKKHLQDFLEPLLHQYKVPLYYSGHVHSYERTYPMCSEKSYSKSYDKPSCPTYIIAGNAGNIEGHNKLKKKQPAYMVKRDNEHYGFGILNVTPSALTWTAYAAADGSVIDTFTLSR